MSTWEACPWEAQQSLRDTGHGLGPTCSPDSTINLKNTMSTSARHSSRDRMCWLISEHPGCLAVPFTTVNKLTGSGTCVCLGRLSLLDCCISSVGTIGPWIPLKTCSPPVWWTDLWPLPGSYILGRTKSPKQGWVWCHCPLSGLLGACCSSLIISN